jgi:hypothetical protein
MQTAGCSERLPEAVCSTSLDDLIQRPYAGLRFGSAQGNASNAASHFLTRPPIVEFFQSTEIFQAQAKCAKQCTSTVWLEWEQPLEVVEGIPDVPRNEAL